MGVDLCGVGDDVSSLVMECKAVVFGVGLGLSITK